MKTTSTLAVAVSLAIISVPAMASINSEVWTTSNGSAVVDSSGNPIRTIHYKDKKVALISQAPKANSSLKKVIQQAVAKLFEADPVPDETPAAKQEIEPVLVAELSIIAQQQDVVAAPVEQAPQVVIKEVAQVKIVAPKVAVHKAVPPKVEYTFNNYEATVLFDTDSATLSADASGNLTQLAMATGLAQSVISVKVIGHADTRGDQAYNMTLSEQRMHSVVNFLDGLKLKVTSMFAKGETSPIVDGQGENLTKSRRVYVAIKTRNVRD
jgi:outer membrane protein OmpA-like peptidoglycan-associated protein